MKKILLLTKQYPGIGGIERSIEALYNELKKANDVKVDIVCLSTDEKNNYIKYPMRYKMLYFEPLKISFSIKSYLSNNIDLLKNHILVSRFLPISYALYKLNVNFIYIPPAVSADNFDAAIDSFKKGYGEKKSFQYFRLLKLIMSKKIFQYFEKKVMEYSGVSIITFSENVKENLIKQNKVATNIEVIPPGIDSNYFYHDSSVYHSFRKKLQISKEVFVLLYVGRINIDKNIALLVDAFNALRISNKKLILVGDGNISIPENKDILMVGRKNKKELFDYYHMADFLVLPSLNEGFGHVLIESLACGTPVIGLNYNKNAINEIIVNNKNGIISECCSVKKLSRALTTAYEKNTNFQKSKEKISIETLEKYNWKNLANRLLIEK